MDNITQLPTPPAANAKPPPTKPVKAAAKEQSVSKPAEVEKDQIIVKATVVPEDPKIPDIPKEPTIKAPDLLVRILSTKRAHESTGDTNFRIWLFNYIKSLGVTPVIKQAGCILVELDPKSTVLFSCHVDTVHSQAESNNLTTQALALDPVFGHIYLQEKGSSSCLGGDDGVGVYIMLEMIRAKKPGKYIFHTGEERGGIGSKAFVSANKSFMDDLSQVVAFDRAVYVDKRPEVIISQGNKPCASKEYGLALAAELNKFDFEEDYEVSERGMYTDSKEYANYVPECVNIACFYNHQHTPNEYVDVFGLERLVEAAIGINWEALPVKRALPAPVPPQTYGQQAFGGGPNGWSPSQSTAKPPQQAPRKPAAPLLTLLEEFDEFETEDWAAFVEDGDVDHIVRALVVMHAKVRALTVERDLYQKYLDVM